MKMNDYQYDTKKTAIYPGQGELQGIIYLALKLNGEAGEVAEKLGKILRDDAGVISPDRRYALCLELGDVLWYLARLADELGYPLDYVADANLEKLLRRKQRGVQGGSGDNR